MSELDLLRRIAELEARLARLESAGAPYTTGSAGQMTTPALNVGGATGAGTGQIRLPGSISQPSIIAGGLAINSYDQDSNSVTSNLYYDAAWKYLGNGYGAAVVFGDGVSYIAMAALNSGGAGVAATVNNTAMFDTSGNTTLYGGLNVGSATGAPTGGLALQDGITAPAATAGAAKLYVDTADGDLKIIFGDGTVKTIATDT